VAASVSSEILHGPPGGVSVHRGTQKKSAGVSRVVRTPAIPITPTRAMEKECDDGRGLDSRPSSQRLGLFAQSNPAEDSCLKLLKIFCVLGFFRGKRMLPANQLRIQPRNRRIPMCLRNAPQCARRICQRKSQREPMNRFFVYTYFTTTCSLSRDETPALG